MKKYLFVIRSLTGGGAERVVSVLASRMARNGHDISIIAYDRTDNDYPVDPAVKVYFMPKAKRGVFGKAGRIADMRKLILQIQPDVIVPFVGTILYVAYLASLPERTPIIRTVRISPWEEGKNIFHKRVLSFMNRQAAAIQVQNEEQIEFFSEKVREKIYVIPNPVSDAFIRCQKLNYSSEIKRIVTAGRLTPQKNQALLIQSFAEAAKQNPDIELRIYGVGPEQERLQQLINDLHLAERCFLCGRNNDMQAALMESDLFILSSDYEGMPNALMEAMAIGLPCISSDCRTGPKTLIKNGESGLLFKTGDGSDLSEKLMWALGNAKEMNQMGQKARTIILRDYKIDSICSKMWQMLETVVDERKH